MANIHSPTAQTLRKALSFNVSANGNSSSVDCRGYTRAIVDVSGVTNGTGTIAAQVQDSPDNSTWTNVTGATVTIGSSVAAPGQHFPIELNLTRRQRYLRVVWSGAAATVNASADIHLFNPGYLGVQGSWDNAPVVV